jgi:pyruvate kinase
MTDRRTRIVATLGPATDRPGVLERMLDLGLDVVRVNFSHGAAADHCARVARVRALVDHRSRPLAVLGDLPGPKLRVLLAAALDLSPGQTVTFAAAASAPGQLGVTEPVVLTDVRPGHRLLLDDGRLQLRAVRADRGCCLAEVEVGGTLLPNKGLNLPDTPLSIPAVTERDRAALAVAARAGADWLALSFVRGPEAADELRAAAKAVGLELPVLAKIERPEAVARAGDIVAAFDGVMVARGDMGVELPLEEVPAAQKLIVRLALALGKPVITATDMLDSMRTNPRPTRAEASDVANAIYDGTDAVMLSGETAVGDYPVEAVACMDRIARASEAAGAPAERWSFYAPEVDDGDNPLAMAVCSAAAQMEADAVIVPTLSGRTARQLARYRPARPIVAPVPRAEVRRQLALVWGVRPVPLAADLPAGADRIDAAVKAAFAAGAVTAGQRVVALAGHPVEGGPRLPTIRLLRVGEGGASDEP